MSTVYSSGTTTPSGRSIEDVWKYPRPAVLEPCNDTIRIVFNGVVKGMNKSQKYFFGCMDAEDVLTQYLECPVS